MPITDRLPTLEQVLSRKSESPLCLYNFYSVMRDRLHMEEVLDLYLDILHHEWLWRRYVRSLQRSGIVHDDDLSEGYQSMRLLSRISHASEEKTIKARQTPKPSASAGMDLEKLDTVRTTTSGQGPVYSIDSGNNKSQPPTTQHDLALSCERILLRYLVPYAAKEVTQLPIDIRQTLRDELEAPTNNPRVDPVIFADTKEYLFELMQRQAYPKFLRLKVWGNVTLTQQLGRLVLGLFCLFVGFSTGLSLIFLGYPPWGVRVWSLLPIYLGVYNLLVFTSGIDPLWVIVLNISEITTFQFTQIKDPVAKQVLRSRSIWLLVGGAVISVALAMIFCAVPPRRI